MSGTDLPVQLLARSTVYLQKWQTITFLRTAGSVSPERHSQSPEARLSSGNVKHIKQLHMCTRCTVIICIYMWKLITFYEWWWKKTKKSWFGNPVGCPKYANPTSDEHTHIHMDMRVRDLLWQLKADWLLACSDSRLWLPRRLVFPPPESSLR